MKTNTAIAAIIELSETMRETAITMPNTARVDKPTCQDKDSNTPKPVATDLPPVKFSQTDLLWPRRAANPASVTIQSKLAPPATVPAAVASSWVRAKE